jgi:Fe-S-cluster containining protein
MKRKCPYCGEKFKGKEVSEHIFDVHQGGGSKFYCRKKCVRCCTDPGAPLELVLSDIERISEHLKISCEEFFSEYGGVLWSSIPGTPAMIPSTGLPFPCKFLKEGKCTIYDVRPLHCRLFPERLYINPSPGILDSFYKKDYLCVDQGFYLDENRKKEVEKLMSQDRRELERTAAFFKNEEFIYDITPEEHEAAERALNHIGRGDVEMNLKRRMIVEAIIPDGLKSEVRKVFESKLKKLDESMDKI